MKYYAVFLFGVFIASIAQILLKKSAIKKYDSILSSYLNINVITGYIILIISSFLCVLAYKEIPLSHGPVLETTSYVWAIFFGRYFFSEVLSIRQIFGVIFVIVGILIVTL